MRLGSSAPSPPAAATISGDGVSPAASAAANGSPPGRAGVRELEHPSSVNPTRLSPASLQARRTSNNSWLSPAHQNRIGRNGESARRVSCSSTKTNLACQCACDSDVSRQVKSTTEKQLKTFFSQYFYFCMSLAMAALVVWGFSRTVNANLFHANPPRPLLLWMHAAAFSTWVVFFTLQSVLVRMRKVSVHRRTTSVCFPKCCFGNAEINQFNPGGSASY